MESNRRPKAYEASALTAELHRHVRGGKVADQVVVASASLVWETERFNVVAVRGRRVSAWVDAVQLATVNAYHRVGLGLLDDEENLAAIGTRDWA